MKRTVGVIGGMGPEATVDLFAKILRATPAACDQDHLRIIIDSNSAVPDRTAAIEGRGPDPTFELIQTAQNLERAGAELLVMPCNTAHYFYPAIRAAVQIPVLHMIEETVRHIRSLFPSGTVTGLLATEGTVRSKLYRRAAEKSGLALIEPDAIHQKLVTESIFGPTGIKAGHYDQPRRHIRRVVEHLAGRGALVVILGCTELPLAVHGDELAVAAVDPGQILAAAAVREALRDDRRAQA
ncbi:MAG: amino acid racemase [Thermaerobacterales bacterium]